MENTINYAEVYSNQLRELYGQESTSDPLYHSNEDIQITGGKSIKIPKLSVSGYKDHTRGSLGFNGGTYSNEYETKTLDHDLWTLMKLIQLYHLPTFRAVSIRHRLSLNLTRTRSQNCTLRR